MTDEPIIDRFSPLYCRYNGFMFGLLDAINQMPWREEDVPMRRLLMQAFLDDAGLDLKVPDSTKLWGHGPPEATEWVVKSQGRLPSELVHSLGLPYLLLSYAEFRNNQEANEKDVTSFRSQVGEILGLLGADTGVLDVFVEEAKGLNDAESPISDRVSACLRVLEALIKPLRVEYDTAFVIMPFSPPYANRYWTLYRPSLEGAEFRSFRAWGNLAREDYGPLLIELIRKSGAVFADLSLLGQNELYEVGAAHALGKPAFLAVEKGYRAGEVSSNLAYDAHFVYESDEDGGHRTATLQLTAQILLALKVIENQRDRPRYTVEALRRETDRVTKALRDQEEG